LNELIFLSGGSIELGETTLEAVQREVQEECGLDPSLLTWLGPAFATDAIFPIDRTSVNEIQFHYVIVQHIGMFFVACHNI
jgi:8-oxo-dGTP pyrophosphatase MutT (NUDIX family)